MRHLRPLLRSSLLGIALAGLMAQAQAVTPDTTVGEALRNLASRAGVAFVGQVLRIDRTGGIVEVVFRVDQPILGAPGGTYTVRQWAGLWPPGMQRFYVSERALVFLHAPATSGLSSTVDGMDGVVPVLPQGANVAPLLDVRRLNARLLRSKGSELPPTDAAALSLAEAAPLIANWRQRNWSEPHKVPLLTGSKPQVSLDPAFNLLASPAGAYVGH